MRPRRLGPKAHGDHFLGLKLLLDRFPNARAFATASTVASMQDQITPDFVRSFWEVRFPGQIPSEFVLPEVLKGDLLSLEGEELRIAPRPYRHHEHHRRVCAFDWSGCLRGCRLQQHPPLPCGMR